MMPDWAPDESGLDYVVTRNGVSNIWRQPLTGGPPVQITHFSDRKDLQLRVVARWPMAVARQRPQQKRRRRDVKPAIAAFSGLNNPTESPRCC